MNFNRIIIALVSFIQDTRNKHTNRETIEDSKKIVSSSPHLCPCIFPPAQSFFFFTLGFTIKILLGKRKIQNIIYLFSFFLYVVFLKGYCKAHWIVFFFRREDSSALLEWKVLIRNLSDEEEEKKKKTFHKRFWMLLSEFRITIIVIM